MLDSSCFGHNFINNLDIQQTKIVEKHSLNNKNFLEIFN